MPEPSESSESSVDLDLALVEATIADLRAALEAGRVTSVELVTASLNRIARYDRHGLALNAVPVLDPRALDEARASDERRARGETLGPLDGIPYTAKDSYRVRGLTVASGSPVFEHLASTGDAFAIGRMRAAGAILLGLTNMPPMANGGMQRGVYGRAESPYNRDYLAAAYLSGSSNGSGVATASSYAAFGLGEETWSSGRSPASNNALVAYTPSRGVISVRGNWPLTPTMDVVVPHTRTVDDLFEVLDVLVADDPETRGDFWRSQPWVRLPRASEVRPAPSYATLRDSDALRGRRFGVPRLYLGEDPDAAWPVEPRPSMLDLWQRARRALEAQGAEVVEVAFPALENYERDRAGTSDGYDRGILPAGFFDAEMWRLTAWAWNDFLDANGDPALHRLADVEGDLIFPTPDGAITDRVSGWFERYNLDLAEYPAYAAAGVASPWDDPVLAAGVRGLEELRRADFEAWLDELGLDGLVFPSAVDVGRADADIDPESWQRAMSNGVWVSTGNTMIRHYGIPTVNVPMGLMADIGMPVNLTFAGRAYDDSALLRYGWAFEQAVRGRVAPASVPELAPLARPGEGEGEGETDGEASAAPRVPTAVPTPAPTLDLVADLVEAGEVATVTVTGRSNAPLVQVFVDGLAAPVARDGDAFTAEATLPAADLHRTHSQWRGPYGAIVTALATTGSGAATSAAAALRMVGGIA